MNETAALAASIAHNLHGRVEAAAYSIASATIRDFVLHSLYEELILSSYTEVQTSVYTALAKELR